MDLYNYNVTFVRTELINFVLPAASEADAEERYLTDGEETYSETVEISVDSIQRQSPELT